MTTKRIKLCELAVGDLAEVCTLLNRRAIRRRLQDLGLVEDTVVECIGKSPGGGMSAYLIRGAVIALRDEDAALVLVTPQETGGAQWD
ncbi:MAG: ferrous iron transport protein A [Clostridia bacterium]|nr:ferrous iron transport protein A [Clostridia bacterium]